MQKPRVLLFYALACSSTTLLLLASTSTRGIKREHATNASFFLRSWELKPENDAEFWVSLRFFEKKHLWVDTKFLSDCYKNSIKMKISLKTENEKTFLNPYNLIKTLNFTTLLKKIPFSNRRRNSHHQEETYWAHLEFLSEYFFPLVDTYMLWFKCSAPE